MKKADVVQMLTNEIRSAQQTRKNARKQDREKWDRYIDGLTIGQGLMIKISSL